MDLAHLSQLKKESRRVYSQLNDPVHEDREHEPVYLVRGGATTGKTAFLRDLVSQFAEDCSTKSSPKRVPIFISPPVRQDDTAQKAILDIAVQIHSHFANAQLPERICDVHLKWQEKVSLVANFLEKESENLVLLLDEPLAWSPRGEVDFFGEKTREFANFLMLDVNVPKVITGEVSQSLKRRCIEVDLKEDSTPKAWLESAPNWGVLAPVAKQISQGLGLSLGRCTGLHVRMLVGLAALIGAENVISEFQDFKTRDSLVERILHEWRGHEELLQAVYSAALVRGPLNQDIFDFLFAKIADHRQREVVRSCLMYEVMGSAAGAVEMHSSTKQNIFAHLSPRFRASQGKLHEKIARYYQEALRAKTSDFAELVEGSSEAFYHYSRSDHPLIPDDVQAFFTDQLNIVGKFLSYKGRYEDAVQVYEQSVKWDPEDDYAHHYLGYNLDIRARNPTRVEEQYAAALRLNPGAVRWHSHYINFLLSNGRMLDAEIAWERALEHLPEGNEIYQTLHKEVAVTAIYMGQTDFVQRVLRNIPDDFRDDEIRYLKAMIRKMKSGSAVLEVLPLSYVPDERVGRQPLKMDRALHEGHQLQGWGLGVVESVSGDHVFTKIVFFDGKAAEGELEEVSFAKAEFASKLAETSYERLKTFEGLYFEIGKYVLPKTLVKTSVKPTAKAKSRGASRRKDSVEASAVSRVVIRHLDKVTDFDRLVEPPKLAPWRYAQSH